MTAHRRCTLLLVVVACLLVLWASNSSALRVHKKPFEVKTAKANLIIDVQGAENSESSRSESSNSAESSEASATESSAVESSSTESSSSSPSSPTPSSASSLSEESSEGSMTFSSESGSSESGSSESGSSESSSRGKKKNFASRWRQPSRPSTDNYGLPPEPEAAKGYTPRPRCNEDRCDMIEESSNPSQDSLSIQDSDSSSDQGCTTNCAPDTSSNAIVGPTTLSQPIGDFNNGMVTVPQTQTRAQPSSISGASSYAASSSSASLTMPSETIPAAGQSSDSCGCNTCPCPTNNGGLVAATPLVSSSSCGCDTCPCPDAFDASPLDSSCGPSCVHLTAAERRAREHEKEMQKVHEEKEKKRVKLEEEMRNHQENMAKIEKLMRSLSFQYSELRRSHESLRHHIGANKAALHQFAGISDSADLDIEDKNPDFRDSLDSIPDFTTTKADDLEKAISAAQSKQSDTLKNSHVKAKDIVKKYLENNV